MKLETTNRLRSASLGRTRGSERRFRYWTFLFDNLNRIMDEIYQSCEEDESIDECKQVIQTLQNHIVDFDSLIEWLQLNKNLEATPQRPNSVSWEVRKSKRPVLSCFSNFNLEKNHTVIKGISKFAKINESENSVPDDQSTNQVNKHNDQSSITSDSLNKQSKIFPEKANGLTIDSNSNLLIQQTSNAVYPFSSQESSILNRCNSLNSITRGSRYVDEDGFQVVRYKQRNKVSQLKIITNNKTTDPSLSNVSPSWALLDSNLNGGDTRSSSRALQLQEKFLSPSRKRPVCDTLKKQEEKQAKAQEAREKLLEKKAGKFKGIVKKVDEIKAQKEEQQMQLKISMEMRLQRADEKRQEQINKIVKKAHNEDAKVNEILFINSLEAGNKKHDIFSKEKVCELRLQDLQKERLQKLEEKASREAAFEKRRQAIEAEKQARIEKLKEQRKLKFLKVEQQLQEKEKERLELAFQKELDRKSKLSALNALHAAEKEELQKKILAKQEESKRRHEENMEQIRQKALELSVKKSSSVINDDVLVCVPYDTVKMCALCKVIIRSEVYLFGHLRGNKHNDAIKALNDGKIPSVEELENYNLKSIIDAPLQSINDVKSFQDCDSEKLKQARKKSKKLKQKIISRIKKFEENYTFNQVVLNSISKEDKHKFSKIIKELNALQSNNRISGQWPSNMIRTLERAWSDLNKLCQDSISNIHYFHSLNGTGLLIKILSRILNGTTERPTSLTDNANIKLTSLYQLLCTQSFEICQHFLQSSNIISILDILYHRINICVNSNLNCNFPYDSVVGSLCELVSASFNCLFKYYSSCSKENNSNIINNIKDIINYLVIIGVIDKLSMIISSIRGSVNDMPKQSLFVKQIVTLFCSIVKLLTLLSSCNSCDISYGIKLTEDETQFMLTLRVNQMCGTVSLLYGFLLHSGAPVRDENVPPTVPDHTLDVARETIRFLNYIALLDIKFMQSILGGEGLSLQIRHICSYLIWYCSHHIANLDLLHEVILLIGNFVVLNTENQTLLQSGQRPTVVQQLCSLPFEYFCDQTLAQILFPTLIVCCFNNDDNMNILKQEMSTSMLSTYIDQTILNLQLKQIETRTNKQSLVHEKWSLAIRFPKNRWNEAKYYFEENKLKQL